MTTLNISKLTYHLPHMASAAEVAMLLRNRPSYVVTITHLARYGTIERTPASFYSDAISLDAGEIVNACARPTRLWRTHSEEYFSLAEVMHLAAQAIGIARGAVVRPRIQVGASTDWRGETPEQWDEANARRALVGWLETITNTNDYDMAYRIVSELGLTPNYRCRACGDFGSHDGEIYPDDCYCNDCYHETFVWCESCTDAIYADDSYWDDGTERVYCCSCYEDLFEWCADHGNYRVDDGCDECDDDYGYGSFHDKFGSGDLVSRLVTLYCENALRNLDPARLTLADGRVLTEEPTEVSVTVDTVTENTIARVLELIGIDRYHRYYWQARRALLDLDPSWKCDNGRTWPKRAKQALHGIGITLDSVMIGKVGDLVLGTFATVTEWVSVTRDLTLSARELGNGASCWHGNDKDYGCSRGYAIDNGLMGLRFWNGPDDVEPIGRVWVQALDESLAPTLELDNAISYVAYNGYGTCINGEGAEKLAVMLNLPQKRVNLYAEGQYVNGETGRLIGTMETKTVRI